jgi:uncharacterized protein YjbI with pentapeptide repeats
MQFYFLTQLVFFVILNPRIALLRGRKMDTLTLFINKIYEENLGLDHYQSLENISVCDYNFNKLTISGAFFKNVEFKNINFENCIFWASHFKNVTFTNCQFIKLQF